MKRILKGLLVCLAGCAVLVFIGTVRSWREQAELGTASRSGSSPVEEVGCPPPYFCHDGYGYVYASDWVSELPEGYELIGATRDVWGEGRTLPAKELEATLEGFVYLRESDPSFACFREKDWDETTRGKERIWLFDRRERIDGMVFSAAEGSLKG